MESNIQPNTLEPKLESIEDFFRHLLPQEHKNAPGSVYYVGDKSLMQLKRLSIIGSREASPEGIIFAKEMASYAVSNNIVIMSGLAKGIDTAAHIGAIESGGKTIAVLGTPLNKYYPKENEKLQKEIQAEHLCISEFGPYYSVMKGNFVLRNYTMALLSNATLIIEAGDNSGTLYQAEETLRLGHPLFIHKHALKSKVYWPEYFIRNGAKVLENIESLTNI